jgi:hypothetical protein
VASLIANFTATAAYWTFFSMCQSSYTCHTLIATTYINVTAIETRKSAYLWLSLGYQPALAERLEYVSKPESVR